MRIVKLVTVFLSVLLVVLMAAILVMAKSSGLTPKNAAVFIGIIAAFWIFYYVWIPFVEKAFTKHASFFEKSLILRFIKKVSLFSLVTWKNVFLVIFSIALILVNVVLFLSVIGK